MAAIIGNYSRKWPSDYHSQETVQTDNIDRMQPIILLQSSKHRKFQMMLLHRELTFICKLSQILQQNPEHVSWIKQSLHITRVKPLRNSLEASFDKDPDYESTATQTVPHHITRVVYSWMKNQLQIAPICNGKVYKLDFQELSYLRTMICRYHSI